MKFLKKANNENYFINFLKEIIPIIIGILIALFIENWNETRKDTAYVTQIFDTVENELIETKGEIEQLLPLQKSLIDSLDFYANNKDITLFQIIRKIDGIQIPKIKTNAWKAISNSKIDLISFNEIISLSNIEEQKEILKDKTAYLLTYLYPNFNETNRNKKEALVILLMDIIETEKATLKLIHEYLDYKKLPKKG
jgi:hypothetical protein